MCSISFYKDTSYNGDFQTFTDPQGKQGSLITGITSLKITDNTWAVVYDGGNYTDNFMKIQPGTDYSNLEDHQRGSNSKDDWKNQIKSFVMYASKPPFWDTSSGGPDIPLTGAQAFFANDTNYMGENALYEGNVQLPSLVHTYYTNASDTLDSSIVSLKTGPGAWLAVYDEEQYEGNSLRVYPNSNSSYEDLNNIKRGDSDDWKNQIKSFQLFNQLPTAWSLSFNLKLFNSLFPDNYPDGNLSEGDAIGYVTQDCQYRIYSPVVTFPTYDTMVINVTVDHIIDMSTDDHVTLSLTFNSDGEISSTTYSWDAGSNYQISDKTVTTVDVTAEMIAATGAPETFGISEAVAAEFIDAFDNACEVFNDISNVMTHWTENDGGRFYMIPVICQVINRVCYSVSKS